MVTVSALETESASKNEKSITTSVLIVNEVGVLMVRFTDLGVSPLTVEVLLSIIYGP
jgi:hypothetical protein